MIILIVLFRLLTWDSRRTRGLASKRLWRRYHKLQWIKSYSEYARFTLHKVSLFIITFYKSTHVVEIIFQFYSYSLVLIPKNDIFLFLLFKRYEYLCYFKLKYFLFFCVFRYEHFCMFCTCGSAGFLLFGATLGITRRRGRRKRRDLIAPRA